MCRLSQYNPISVCHDDRLQNLFKQTHQSVCGALVFPQIIFGFAVCTLFVNRFAAKLLAIWRCVNFSPWYSTNRMGLLQIRSTQMKPSIGWHPILNQLIYCKMNWAIEWTGKRANVYLNMIRLRALARDFGIFFFSSAFRVLWPIMNVVYSL